MNYLKEKSEVLKNLLRPEKAIDLISFVGGEKPGVLINDKRIADSLGAFYSRKHGGYMTYSEKLLKQWNKSVLDPVAAKNGAHKFLGYPICCTLTYGQLPIGILTAYKVKYKSKKELGDLFATISLVPHVPCTIDCKQTIKLADKNLKLMNQAIKLGIIPKKYLRFAFNDKLDLYKHRLESINDKVLKKLRADLKKTLFKLTIKQLGFKVSELNRLIEELLLDKENVLRELSKKLSF